MLYTPVNEPLTTAGFSGLYGHWYPHGVNVRTFVRALLHQVEATVRSMRAIREITPEAQLVQTEDLGKVYSVDALRYQADFENERRWLTWDLLCGYVDERHPLWDYLVAHGASRRFLEQLCAEPCPPAVIGVNHYLTSERYLDDALASHPEETYGGNGRDCYADLAAVRVIPETRLGIGGLLREVYARYRIPVAVTECHLGCTPDEQLRWLVEVWESCVQLRDEGTDVRAVTAWALLGSYDWNSLVTREAGHYEPGAYDVRGGEPRATVLAEAIHALATEGQYWHPDLHCLGWWHGHRVNVPVMV